jgi:ribosomal protein S13
MMLDEPFTGILGQQGINISLARRILSRMERLEVGDLTEEEIRIVKEFIDSIRARRAEKLRRSEEIKFKSWPLKVKGRLTREEIYDYL